MNEIKDIQVKHIMREARIRQQMYSNHECTADEVEGRTANDKIITLAGYIEKLKTELETAKRAYADLLLNAVNEARKGGDDGQ